MTEYSQSGCIHGGLNSLQYITVDVNHILKCFPRFPLAKMALAVHSMAPFMQQLRGRGDV